MLAAVRAAMREAVRAAVRRCRCCASLWCLGMRGVHSAVRPGCLACCLLSCFVLIIFLLLVFSADASPPSDKGAPMSADSAPRPAAQSRPEDFTMMLCRSVGLGVQVGDKLLQRRQFVFRRCVKICC